MKAVRPWDLLDPREPKVSRETYDERYAICQGCDDFHPGTKRCDRCGCFMFAKCLLANAECPKGLWGADSKLEGAAG